MLCKRPRITKKSWRTCKVNSCSRLRVLSCKLCRCRTSRSHLSYQWTSSLNSSAKSSFITPSRPVDSMKLTITTKHMLLLRMRASTGSILICRSCRSTRKKQWLHNDRWEQWWAGIRWLYWSKGKVMRIEKWANIAYWRLIKYFKMLTNSLSNSNRSKSLLLSVPTLMKDWWAQPVQRTRCLW